MNKKRNFQYEDKTTGIPEHGKIKTLTCKQFIKLLNTFKKRKELSLINLHPLYILETEVYKNRKVLVYIDGINSLSKFKKGMEEN